MWYSRAPRKPRTELLPFPFLQSDENNRFPNGPPLIRVSTRLNPRVLLQVSCGLPVARARHKYHNMVLTFSIQTDEGFHVLP